MDAPLEKGLAALAGPDAVVVARGVVVAHGTKVHVGLSRGGGGGAQGRVRPLAALLTSLQRLDGAAGDV